MKMEYTYFSPKYGLFVTKNKTILTHSGRVIPIVKNGTTNKLVKWGEALRVPLYSLNNDLIKLGGKQPFKRPFMKTRKKELMQRDEAFDYIYYLYSVMGMSIGDIAVAFGCHKRTVSSKIELCLKKENQ